MGSNHILLRRFALSLSVMLMLCIMVWLWAALQREESTLAIRPMNQANMPDGFSISHHLDANGIRFKSITPQDDALLITFESSEQSAAAKRVLDSTLPHVYVVALQDEGGDPASWLSLLRDTSHRFG
ncbi:TPA: EnvZ/OmpR regulon moderator MzrA [Kluyvera cryocrescens]|uniref:Modulator protein MzrA n=1 Tax=Kluyvera cryocrescens TaxID=580 RepID=A0A2X3EBJ0_KLUCR|nr:EnvZ/OmpR regulon moderator MzrA [Kluyvera cryocrescens]MCX2866829.1 EnvZ/OmpR regulon moderator MzrA [Kluyvera cryocrescens]MDU5684717.1 EnvZ/OmpR regulon moderator MzrA [Kluyvera cryocrescens]MDW3776240.1 EnvZ/OmpR regulon moderator MzrA [Kluyvera cryocrescens]MEB6633774.1 EnvZ/OmpR regulon moderator MzrA [Kluyvera cryocrescens]MEB7556466.1 EnvZ/OmpR regulon moderator MzrA [Kluyvera cryocrescens]